MVKNNGCCDLKYAQELKELGFKQGSLFSWRIDYLKKATLHYRPYTDDTENFTLYPAYTGTELGEALPPIYSCQRKHPRSDGKSEWECADNTDMVHFFADTEANAKAKMLIWAIKKGKVNVQR